MKIKLLLANTDGDYLKYLAKVISEKYSDMFEVTVLTDKEKYLQKKYCDEHNIALVSEEMYDVIDFSNIDIRILFVNETGKIDERFNKENTLKKYQRISSIRKEIIEKYSEVSNKAIVRKTGVSIVSAFWSPIGGSGKTTSALAYASKKTLENKKVLYLNLESFASTSIYFPKNNTSLSTIFSNLDKNIEMYIESNAQKDPSTEIYYFEAPTNYDDINGLKDEHIQKLIKGCSNFANEVVIDLSSCCNDMVKKVFESSDNIYVVKDMTITNDERFDIFMSQSNIALRNKHKITQVNNKMPVNGVTISNGNVDVPYIDTQNPVLVYKTLSSSINS